MAPYLNLNNDIMIPRLGIMYICTAIFDIFLLFAQNIDLWYTLEPSHCFTGAVLTSTHDLCLRAKLRKKYTLLNPTFTILKVGCEGCELYGHVGMIGEHGSVKYIITCVIFYSSKVLH